MRPQWLDMDNLPYDNMWVDNPVWVPVMLDNFALLKATMGRHRKTFNTYFLYDGCDKYLEHRIEHVEIKS